MRSVRSWLAVVGMVVMAASAQANVRLPAIFSDNMVLQQGKPVAVWGWADAGEQVTVACQDQKKTTTAGADGRWMVRLDPIGTGAAFEVIVSGKNSITLKNVVGGEVWICSGQSNMEWPLRASNGAEQVIAESANPSIRLFTVQKNRTSTPQTDCKGQWEEASPANTPNFSAVGYYFGRDLQKALGVPVGLIHTSWGGTPIEAWTSRPVQESDAEMSVALEQYARQMAQYKAAMAQYEKDAATAKAEGKRPPGAPWAPWEPASLYNAMVAPLVPFTVNGAIWYQGESNAGNAKLYQKQMPAMIQSWRKDFQSGEWPFLIVSLANFMGRQAEPGDSAWAELREAQAMTAATCPKTGLAIAIDIGEEKDIHPRNKLDVGRRLALAGLKLGYGKEIVYSGPVFKEMKAEDSAVVLSFQHADGLVAKGGELKGFAVAGADRKWVWADAKIEGDRVRVSSPKVEKPVAVRYGWADNPDCNLYNQANLPAVPFRTDDWPRK